MATDGGDAGGDASGGGGIDSGGGVGGVTGGGVTGGGGGDGDGGGCDGDGGGRDGDGGGGDGDGGGGDGDGGGWGETSSGGVTSRGNTASTVTPRRTLAASGVAKLLRSASTTNKAVALTSRVMMAVMRTLAAWTAMLTAPALRPAAVAMELCRLEVLE